MSDDSPRPRTQAEREMAGYLSLIATGPRLSKDLPRDQAQRAMELVLERRVDPVQAAVFLVALRMKRESRGELFGVLDALDGATEARAVDADDLVDMAEPYNGYLRHLPAAPFVPALLAACGVACAIHGCRDMGPKWGLTAHRVLAAAGVSPGLGADQAAAQVGAIGWAYLDQPAICPALAELARLRTLVVKRSCLSLLEKLLRPLRARRTHLWIGYTHREYPEILQALARRAGYHSMLAVRGVEGGVLSSLSVTVRGARYHGDAAGDAPLPVDIGGAGVLSPSPVRAPSLPGAGALEAPGHGDAADAPPEERLDEWAREAARAGLCALAGEPGATADMMVLGTAAVLRHLGRADDLAHGVALAREALGSGEAARRFAAAHRLEPTP